VQEVPASSIPMLTDVLTPGKPAPADGLARAPAEVPVLMDVLVPGGRAHALADGLPPVLTEVLKPGRAEPAGGVPASGEPLAEPSGALDELMQPASSPALSLLTDVLAPGRAVAVAAEAEAQSESVVTLTGAGEPLSMPPLLTDVLTPGKPADDEPEAFDASREAAPPTAGLEAEPLAAPVAMPPLLTDVLQPDHGVAAEPADALPSEWAASAMPVLTDVLQAGHAVAAEPIEAPSPTISASSSVPPPVEAVAESTEILPSPPPGRAPDLLLPTAPPPLPPLLSLAGVAAEPVAPPSANRPLSTSPLLAGETASDAREAAPVSAASMRHDPARPTELTLPDAGEAVPPAAPPEPPSVELQTAFDAPSGVADALPASHPAPEAVAPPPLASFVAAAADARVDAQDIADRLHQRVAAYLGGNGGALIEARCQDALREHGARLVGEITREVARTLEAEMSGWVREAVDDELARRAARGADPA
jgi:hypothetical protein